MSWRLKLKLNLLNLNTSFEPLYFPGILNGYVSQSCDLKVLLEKNRLKIERKCQPCIKREEGR